MFLLRMDSLVASLALFISFDAVIAIGKPSNFGFWNRKPSSRCYYTIGDSLLFGNFYMLKLIILHIIIIFLFRVWSLIPSLIQSLELCDLTQFYLSRQIFFFRNINLVQQYILEIFFYSKLISHTFVCVWLVICLQILTKLCKMFCYQT